MIIKNISVERDMNDAIKGIVKHCKFVVRTCGIILVMGFLVAAGSAVALITNGFEDLSIVATEVFCACIAVYAMYKAFKYAELENYSACVKAIEKLDAREKTLMLREPTYIETLAFLSHDPDIRKFLDEPDFYDAVLNDSDNTVVVVESDGECYAVRDADMRNIIKVSRKVDWKYMGSRSSDSPTSVWLHIPDHGKWYVLDHRIVNGKGVSIVGPENKSETDS